MSLHLDGHNISDIYVGSSKLDKIFVGEDLVYSQGGVDPFTIPLNFYINPSSTLTETHVKLLYHDDRGIGALNNPVSTTYNTTYHPNISLPDWRYSYDLVNWERITIGTPLLIDKSTHRRLYVKSFANYYTLSSCPWHHYYTDGASKLPTESQVGLTFVPDDMRLIVSGNISSLLAVDVINWHYTIPYCFEGLLLTPGTVNGESVSFYLPAIVTDTNFLLPAETAAEGCYSRLFYHYHYNSFAVPQLPDLPATALGIDCYMYMFCGYCTASPNTTARCTVPYRIPLNNTATSAYAGSLSGMFTLDETNSDSQYTSYYSPEKNTIFYVCTY